MIKLTFIGDIMCEEPLLKASKKGKSYDFRTVFRECKELFSESDFVIGNLETPLAGESVGYSKELFSFNAPDSFAEAIKDSGVGIVTTATNHALDRDVPGLLRTLEVLDDIGLDHLGSYRTEEDRNKGFSIEAGKFRIGLLNYTYGTNVYESPYYLDESEYYLLNLLMPQRKRITNTKRGLKRKLSNILHKIIPYKQLLKIKKILRREYVNKYTDTLNEKMLDDSYLERIRKDMELAKAHNDIVIVSLHIGGQFNEAPGPQVEYFTKLFSDLGADCIINTHAHVVQPIQKINKTFVVHCLGNVSISPSSIYIPHELKPEYSIALHLWIGDDLSIKKSFSILKIVEDGKHRIRVIPIDKMNQDAIKEKDKELIDEATFIYNRLMNKSNSSIEIQHEYVIEE